MMTVLPKAAPTWQKQMQLAFRSVESLLKFLELDENQSPLGLNYNPHFPILVSRAFADQMEKGNWHDPLLLQVLPLEAEKSSVEGFNSDAVGDLASQVIPGLLHKYSSRALLMISPYCAIHCRYCFRREFPYRDLPKAQSDWEAAWSYISKQSKVNEIVLSGGDPLFLSNQKLGEILNRTLALPNIETIRFHTRLPVVLPSRIDEELVEKLTEVAQQKTLVIVIHCNHENEIGDGCYTAISQLKQSGAVLLNQTVLLKGINDDAQTLMLLSKRLIKVGVLPYYLHQLDRVKGTAHFEVNETQGLGIMAKLRGMLPGYLVPRYVREVAGEVSKSLIG